MAVERVVALAGGVGGAKLADGLATFLPPDRLTVVVNVGDDFKHYGLHISPDVDTVMYTLAGVANPQTGWGIIGESWAMREMMQSYGEEIWFSLGDRDIATHILRTHSLARGHRMTSITQRLAQQLGIRQHILPATDAFTPTMVETVEYGTLPFQEYFVRYRWQPTVTRVWYDNNHEASLTPEVIEALNTADAIVICPSNPILSIDPILSVGTLRDLLAQRSVPCVAVSPLLHGRAIKGPARKIMEELGLDPSTNGITDFYAGLIDSLVVDRGDAPDRGTFFETNILMQTPADRVRLAQEILNYIGSLQ